MPPNGGTQIFFTPAVNPSVSLTADSSPYTGEPGSGLPRQKICLFPRAWIASAGLHRGAGGDTYPWRNKNPRASGLHRPGTFAEKEIIFFVCGTRLSGARRKGCAPLASPVQGEVGGGRRSEGLWVLPNGVAQAFLALTVNPSVSLTADSSPYTGELRSGLPGRKSAFSHAHGSRLPGCTGEPGAILTRGGTRIPAHPVCTDRGRSPKRKSSFSCAARACQAHGGKAAHPLPPLCKGRWAVDAARRGCCVLTNGVAQAFLALTVNPSVSLTADSSPCTGEPGSGLPRQKISLFPRAWIASAGLHRGAGGDTYPWRNKNPRASGLHRPGTFAEKEIIFFVCGTRLSGARRKGCAPLASPVQGEVGGGCRSEGLLRAAKRGHANIFYACRQPLSQPDG